MMVLEGLRFERVSRALSRSSLPESGKAPSEIKNNLAPFSASTPSTSSHAGKENFNESPIELWTLNIIQDGQRQSKRQGS
jgi:hypothetical protein